jgi:prepilin-type N-terminal cleavage/methylation domain-containing protein
VEILKGFTLIELLVVIAIIAVLVALAFPILNRVRSSANGAKATSSLRALGVAINAYAADNDMKLPGSATVAIYNWTTTKTSPAQTTASLTAYVGTYLDGKSVVWIYPSSVGMVHFPVLDCPGLAPELRTNCSVQFVKIDWAANDPDNRFGAQAGDMATAASTNPQPKRLPALSKRARASAIVTTADQGSYPGGGGTSLLPKTGLMGGKRPFLFLDGSVLSATNTTVWER